ncbi:MAG: TIGR03089 family protein [Propionibacteriaceae bacterium]
MKGLIADRLRQRARTDGGSPLVTYYDLGSGERTELSATSFLNWVDKTSNLLVDEYQLDPGAVVDLDLARRAPGHWVTLVIELAAWQVGATVVVGGAHRVHPDLLVLGPDWESYPGPAADNVLACSLHPLGLGFTSVLPSGISDFSLEVRGQSDFYPASPRAGDELAWLDPGRSLTQSDLVDVSFTAGRRLVRPDAAWPTVQHALVFPVLGGGSSVVVVGDDSERLQRIVETERVDVDAA